MYRVVFKYIFVLLSFTCALAQGNPGTTILYKIDPSKTRIVESLPPIYINFSSATDVERFSNEIVFRFRADAQSGHAQNLSWNIQGSEKERLWYFSTAQFNIEMLKKYGSVKLPFLWTNKVYPFIRQKSIREHIKGISQVRGSYTHITNDRRYQDLHFQFKSDLHTATQSTNRTINLDDLPIKIHGPYTGRLIYRLDQENYVESEYRIIASSINILWDQDYIYYQSKDSLYHADIKLDVKKPSLLRQGWSIKLTLPPSEEIVWDRGSIESRIYSIPTVSDSINYTWLSPTEIMFIPQITFPGDSEYVLKDLAIKTNRISKSVKVNISISPDGKKYYNYGKSENGLKVVQPKIVVDTKIKKSFITLYKGNKNLIIPNIVVDQGSVRIPREVLQSVSLEIQDGSDVNWTESRPNFGSIETEYERQSERKLRYEVSRLNFNRGQISLKAAEFINRRQSRDQIYLDVKIDLKTTSILLGYPFPITIGQPKASIVENNIVLGSSNDPTIQRLFIYEDPNVSTLGIGDTISYILEDNGGVEFDPEKRFEIEHPNAQLRIDMPLKQYDRVNFIVKSKIEPGDTLKIFNLPLKIYDKDSRIIRSRVEFRSVHGTRYSIPDQQHIEIVNVNIDFSKTAEFYPKSQRNSSAYDLPSLTIQNDGSVDILHGKLIKIRLESASNYQFEKNNLYLEGSPSIESRDIRVSGDQIEITFPSGLEAHAFIKIGGIGLKLSADHKLFYKTKLTANFGAEKNYVTSIHTITYGKPSFESPYIQKLVSGAQDGRLYTIACDFGNMPQTFNELEDIIFRLPPELGMSWDPNMDLSLVNDDHQVVAIKAYTQNFGQDIRVHIDKTARERLNIGTKFEINGLRIGVPLAKQLASFRLSVSIDQGQTLSFVTPALQGMGSKYGARQCETVVDWGLIVIEITPAGSISWKKDIATLEGQPVETLKL